MTGGNLINKSKRKREQDVAGCSSTSSLTVVPTANPVTAEINQLTTGNIVSESNNTISGSSTSSAATANIRIIQNVANEQDHQHQDCPAKRNRHDNYDTPSDSSDSETEHANHEDDDSDSSSDNNDQESTRHQPKNVYLIEALKKIIELQNELQDFENDLNNINESNQGHLNDELDAEVSYINNNVGGHNSNSNSNNNNSNCDQQESPPEQQHNNFEAEALGFAMCARETLLFLRNEGIPENSLLYKALKDKLVGKSHGIPI